MRFAAGERSARVTLGGLEGREDLSKQVHLRPDFHGRQMFSVGQRHAR